MLIHTDLRYLDTCVLQMFIDQKDPLRYGYGIRYNSKIESSLISRNRGTLCVPMPALGESICKVKDKCEGRESEIMTEHYRLLDSVLHICYIRDAPDTFGLAKTLPKDVSDDRNRMSPMDALITATATVDPDYSVLYTTDSKLLSDARVSEIIDDWRSGRGYIPLSTRDVSDIIKP